MAEDQDKRAAPGNRTMQIDALPDIELIDNAVADAKARTEAGASIAPPPLPPRAGRPGVPWLVIGVTVLVTGGLGALGAYLFVPAAAPAPPVPAAAAAPPEAAPTEAAPTEAPGGEAPTEVNRVTLEDEVLIGIEAPDAGLTPTE